MKKVQIARKQYEDIGSFYDLLKSDAGVIEAFFLKPDETKATEYFNERQAFIESVAAYNHQGFTCYAGIQPRRASLMESGRPSKGEDVTALRLLAVDLDPCKPRDEAGNKMKINASDEEKEACLAAAMNIADALVNGNMGYRPPVLTDSGSGFWLFMPIPEIVIHDGSREEMAARLETWGRKFKEHFQQDGVEIDQSVFELHRLTKIPGTKVFSYPDEPGRPQRISAILSTEPVVPDEKLRQDFLTMLVTVPPKRETPSGSFGGTYRKPERIFESCYLLKFLEEKGSSGVSMPHAVRLALSTFSLALGDLDNDLTFIRRILGGCPDFSEAKTRRYLELNVAKSAPYGCEALRDLVVQHFRDFDPSKCQCNLSVSRDHAGNSRKPSPIRFAGILPEDLMEVFSDLELSGDPFRDYLKMKRFSEEVLTCVDSATAQVFFDSVKKQANLSNKTIKDLEKARKAATAEDATQAQRLIELAKDAELFRNPDGVVFATIDVDGHRETHPIKAAGFRNWLKRLFYQESEKPPSNQPLQDALGILEAKGMFEGPELPVFTRVGGRGNAIYIDTGNKQWEALEITPAGWRVIQNPPVKFRRPRGMMPLPCPVSGRTLEALRPYLNLSNDDDFKLIAAWVIAAIRQVGPYPVLVLNGEQGTAKSTLSKILKALIDPSSSPLRSIPKEARDLAVFANNNWVLALDNLSKLPDWLSDAICRLATGGGFAARELYTDDLEVIFTATRSVVLNGISEFVTRHDLADRCIVINLSPISEKKRLSEKKLWADFEHDAPGILGALCDAVSCGLRNIDSVKLDRLPRMADFALWITAAEEALPWSAGGFMKAYTRNLKEVVEQTLDADLVASAVRSYIQDNLAGFEGSPGDFLNLLCDREGEKITRSKSWPKSPSHLTQRLKRAATSLRAFGIEVVTGLRLANKKRGVTVKSIGDDKSPAVTTDDKIQKLSSQNKDESFSDVAGPSDDRDDRDDKISRYSQDAKSFMRVEL